MLLSFINAESLHIWPIECLNKQINNSTIIEVDGCYYCFWHEIIKIGNIRI